jgi:hypothetical protein
LNDSTSGIYEGVVHHRFVPAIAAEQFSRRDFLATVAAQIDLSVTVTIDTCFTFHIARHVFSKGQ